MADHRTPQQVAERLDRAHRMSCSDPDDPERSTLYSEGRDAIRQLLRATPTEQQIEQAAVSLDEDAFCLSEEEFRSEYGGAPEWSSASQAGRQRAAIGTVRQVLAALGAGATGVPAEEPEVAQDPEEDVVVFACGQEIPVSELDPPEEP